MKRIIRENDPMYVHSEGIQMGYVQYVTRKKKFLVIFEYGKSRDIIDLLLLY